MGTFEVQFMDPLSIKPYYRNNKKHGKTQIILMARILRKHGFDQPIVVDKDMVIIKGHGRYLAAIECKMSLVPVVVRDDLEDWQVKASRIADNQSFAMSDIDEEKSNEEIGEFVKNGGVGAEFFFDFLRPPTPTNLPNPVEVKGDAVQQSEPVIAGALMNCPKCSYTFMEA